MYCSSCGVAVAQGLSYCHYCGAKLNQGDSVTKSSDPRPEYLIFAMMATFILGLIGITILIGILRVVLELHVGQVLAFALLSFLIMLLLEGVFIFMLLRRKGTQESGKPTPLKQQPTNELAAGRGELLPEPTPSVTEHTTRTFEPIYSERKSS